MRAETLAIGLLSPGPLGPRAERIEGMKKRLALAGALAALLAGCMTQPAAVVDRHTGKTTITSKEELVSSGLLSGLSVAAAYTSTSGYQVATSFISTGLGWHFFREAWSYGKQYGYRVVAQDVLGCRNGCSLQEQGIFLMPEADFRRAAMHGLDFKLVGSKGSVEARVPPERFQEVLALQGKK